MAKSLHLILNKLFKKLLPLSLSLILMAVVWHIIQIKFTPVEGSIRLENARLYTDTIGQCQDSIPDTLAFDAVFTESLPELLSHCITNLKSNKNIPSRQVQIPHEWRKDIAIHPDILSGKVLYHFDYKFTTKPQGLWAIALPAVSQNTAVFLNDNLLGWSGSFEQPVARNASRPQMFTIPEGELKEGLNQFEVYIVSKPSSSGFLDEVYIAPAEMLKPAFQHYYFFRHTLPWTITLTIAVLSFFMFLLWIYRRQDSEYGLFALSGFFWVIHTLDQFVVDIPFSGRIWDGMIYLSAGFLSLSAVFFIHRLLNWHHPKFEKTLLIIACVLMLLMLILPNPWFYSELFNLSGLLAIAMGFYLFVISSMYAFKSKKAEWYTLALAIGIIAIFALYDLMMMIGLRPLYEGSFLHFGAPFLLLSFTWIMLRRFVNTLQAAETYNQELRTLNQELENRVEARGKKIAQSYETIRVLGQEQVLLKERSRIMRDMHDGIGVYLTSMLRQLENNEVDRQQLSESAHNALNDLRLMIDSLGSTSTDLATMLGMFRTRISVALKACNVKLEWRVEELPAIKSFGPERALNLLRILQEAVTNILKHSKANCVYFSAYSETNDRNQGLIYIEVRDNGCGFTDKQNGNGLKNMQYRAQKIKAQFAIDSSESGSCVTVTLPISEDIQPSNKTIAAGNLANDKERK